MALNKDADIMNEIIQRLHARVRAGAATFLLKVKSHKSSPTGAKHLMKWLMQLRNMEGAEVKKKLLSPRPPKD